MKPKMMVNYKKYTLFMSFVAHELKRLGKKDFILKYENNSFKGIKGKYMDSMVAYLRGDKISMDKIDEVNKVVVDPFIYKCYFLYRDKGQFYAALKNAIPQFLVNGLLIENIQEAVKRND